ncbi:M24 family metallopeptidase [Methanosphaera sp. WGK6]|uniref:M24 family metallopeptidase n=1 Tax=Methanosphaera sp. WGK6 TaxID=1561964 RepID=UPI00084C8055|nr:M24 family metallopeptidase [Methanosphaera sp. WGK6]OED30390.1 methionine aminopeptidase [Methanosphaera sp. WGK6]
MYDEYIKAGKIAASVRKAAVKRITSGMKVIDLIEWVEAEIKRKGAGLSFPCNISINDITSHYTSPPGDDTIFCNGDIVKIDLGTHIDGYIADTAETVIVTGDNIEFSSNYSMPGRLDDGNPQITTQDFEERVELIEASRHALTNAISIIHDGITLDKISSELEKTIQSHGFNPIGDLTGHSISRYKLHSGLQIPSVSTGDAHILHEGDVIAIEPFVTSGVGLVETLPQHYIYSYLRTRPFGESEASKLLKYIQENNMYFPFTKRYFLDLYDENKLNQVMHPLITSRAIFPYKLLREASGAMNAQCEHTIIVEKEGCIVTTL